MTTDRETGYAASSPGVEGSAGMWRRWAAAMRRRNLAADDGDLCQKGGTVVTACPVCGPQPEPIVHVICHPVPGLSRSGCGHGLRDHSEGLRCKVCGTECGIDCRVTVDVIPGQQTLW